MGFIVRRCQGVGPKFFKMVRVFSWEYFSFLQIDDATAYKEVMLIPFMILVLGMVWMKLVKSEKATDMNFEQAYQDTLANEVDGGTELDSPDEDADAKDEDTKEEEVAAPKDEAEMKDD